MIVLNVVFLFLQSCGFLTGPDPAEKLAFEIENKASELLDSEESIIKFDYVPSPERKLEKIIGQDEVVTVELKQRPGRSSLIHVNSWFWTSYHNWFVQVNREFSESKKLGDPFRVTLKKSDRTIEWVNLE